MNTTPSPETETRGSHSSPPLGSALLEICAEVDRATAKFPTWPTDALHAVGVVAEEMGELQKEVMQLTYEPHKSTKESVRKEAVQLAAMSLRFLMSLDRYEYAPRPQHSQNDALSDPMAAAPTTLNNQPTNKMQTTDQTETRESGSLQQPGSVAACKSCEHFLPIRDNEFQGKCRRYPPAFCVNAMFIWPTVAVGARCGEYKPLNDQAHAPVNNPK